jgi:rSAM/selenodomain-associated transferase 1
MTEHIVQVCREMIKTSNIRLAVHFTGGSEELMQEWLGNDIPFRSQHGNDLGQRMHYSFEKAWQNGAQRAVILGSDCPQIDVVILKEALHALKNNHLVLGPSTDGGYYIIGTTCDLPKEIYSSLFRNISWGTAEVFPETLRRTRKKGLKTAILKKLHDIDLPDDLKYFDYHPDPQ